MTLALPHTPAPPAPPPVIFSRRRKAAIIVRLLLSEGASLPLDTLPDDLQAALTAEIAAMRYIDGETLRAVVGEFLTEMERVGLTFPGGVDGALSLLDGHISETAAAGLRAASGEHPADPWKTIAALETETLIPMVQAESTEVAAVLLSKLATVKAAEILGKLPGAQARRIACAISLTGQVGPETVARIGQTLVEQIASAPQPAFDTPAAARSSIMSAARTDSFSCRALSPRRYAAEYSRSSAVPSALMRSLCSARNASLSAGPMRRR